jgi:hypothetical protein
MDCWIPNGKQLSTIWKLARERPNFRIADKPLVAPLPREIAAFLLDCRWIFDVSLQAKQLEQARNIPPAVCQSYE